MPRTGWGWMVTAGELERWVIHDDAELLVLNKPPHVVCHPSKHGPWSSLVGAAREWLGLERVHLPSRLDRETSGVVVLAKNALTASKLQRAMERRRVQKTYVALLWGRLAGAVTVEEAIGKHPDSEVLVRRAVVAEGGQRAVTRFEPLGYCGEGRYTLVRAAPETGRLHQIRVHAAWLGHAVVGDKLYGPDERLFIEFLREGWSARHDAELDGMDHHALHALEWGLEEVRRPLRFRAEQLPGTWARLVGEEALAAGLAGVVNR